MKSRIDAYWRIAYFLGRFQCMWRPTVQNINEVSGERHISAFIICRKFYTHTTTRSCFLLLFARHIDENFLCWWNRESIYFTCKKKTRKALGKGTHFQTCISFITKNPFKIISHGRIKIMNGDVLGTSLEGKIVSLLLSVNVLAASCINDINGVLSLTKLQFMAWTVNNIHTKSGL